MSNLAVSNVSSDLMDLAAELGLDLGAMEAQSNLSRSGGGTYTNFTKVETARQVKGPKWSDGGVFKWGIEGNPEYEEDLDMSDINQLGGFIVHSEIQSSQAKATDATDEMGEKLCSVVGYKNPVTGSYIKALPDFYPLTNMYGGWNKELNIPMRDTPHSLVEQLDLLGSKGARCVDCIRNRESFNTSEGGKTSECTPYGRLYFYATELTSVKLTAPPKGSDKPGKKVVTKKVSDLIEGQTGILLVINLPTKTGLRGIYDKDPELTIQSYGLYLRTLQYKYTDDMAIRRSPKMNYTTITIKAPPAGRTSTKNFLHFENVESFDVGQLKEAIRYWDNINPNKNIEELNIANYGGSSVSTVVSDDYVSTSVAVVSNDDSTAYPFD